MSDNAHLAKRRRQSRISPIWIVPVVAVLIGAWMLYNGFINRGPLITLEIENAEGIEAGKTSIKARNVQVGHVTAVRLSEDFSHAIIEARLNPGTEGMLNSATRFWVVKPRIGREGISGLSTVLSGAYIQLLPGHAGTSQRDFKVLAQPPVAPPGAKGLRLKLVSGLSNALSTGDPITYEGLTVGRVETTRFDPKAQTFTHKVFIESPYGSLVTDTTRFWTASGISIDVNPSGVEIHFQSLETILGGGSTFGVPENLPPGKPVQSGAVFKLYSDEASAEEGSFDQFIEYVLLVKETVRGLEPGAPVEYRGIRVGTVASVPWKLGAANAGKMVDRAVPVLIRIEPERFEGKDSTITLAQWQSRIEHLMARDLRASLKTGNLLTGSLFVDIDFHPGAPDYEQRTYLGREVFPLVSTGVAQITQSITRLLDKLNALQIGQVLSELNRTLEISQPTLVELGKVLQEVHALLGKGATRAAPANLNATLTELRRTLRGFSSDSAAYQQLTTTLENLDALMQQLQPLIRTLSEQPNALIFGNETRPDPQPRAPHR
ncbi:MAG: intermembrane transport protein PqiB [Nitrococcus sp.]|nr:intermembrane transport protein PqiB [Nitrococcus sp.]